MWAWEFGDGTTEGRLANASRAYQNPETYTVKLTASSQTGGTSTKTKEGFITVTQAGGRVSYTSASPNARTSLFIVQCPDT